MNPMALLTLAIAEETMKRLSTDGQVQSNVDWLTEVVRRLSESAMDSSMNIVKVSPMRLEKVHPNGSFMVVKFDFRIMCSGRSTSRLLWTKNGVGRKSWLSKMQSNTMEQSCVLSEMKLEPEVCRRSCAFMVTGKGE